ncbi:MAG: gamma-glutamyl-gamma-aminobutyrate hydrolase family protein [Solirubrobacteraceae bacterium]
MKLIALGDRDPAHLTHREIDATLALLSAEVDCRWVPTDSTPAAQLDGVQGVWLLPGTPYRDDDAARAAIHHCLATGTPFLGTCGGFQYACVELARSWAGVSDAASAELHPDADALVVAPLACTLYGERRTVTPVAGTRLAAICGTEPFEGYHHCGYGLADPYEEVLAEAGVVISAHAPDAGVEAIELPGHPFFMATAFQPQVGSGESGVVPALIGALVDAAARLQPPA